MSASGFSPFIQISHQRISATKNKFFFHGGLCSMHKYAQRVNIGRNSETENPIGPRFIARSRKKAAVTPYFFI
jgi:hypothetical protein